MVEVRTSASLNSGPEGVHDTCALCHHDFRVLISIFWEREGALGVSHSVPVNWVGAESGIGFNGLTFLIFTQILTAASHTFHENSSPH